MVVNPIKDEMGRMIARRTIKYLKALLHGSYVVHFSWILDSLIRGKLVPESGYMVDGDEIGLGTPTQMVLTGGNRDLFLAKVFAFVGELGKIGVTISDLMELVNLGGGTIVEPDSWEANKSSTYRVIVTNLIDLPLFETSNFMIFNERRSYYSHKMILDAISINAFSSSAYRLCFH